MNIPTRDDLYLLLQPQSGMCVSIVMPAHRKGAETRQDPIRYKNLAREARRRLEGASIADEEIERILRPVEALQDVREFRQHQANGLAVFAAANIFRAYSLPLDVEERVVVGGHFHVKPLLPLFTEDGVFYVLVLSQNEVRLLHGTHFKTVELQPEELPAGLVEALWYDRPERELQYHTGAAPQAGRRRRAMFHGHGARSDGEKERLIEYFRAIDRGLRDLNRTGRIPMVLAGVDYLQPLFREAAAYPWVLEEGITGNPEEFHPEELHLRAWSLVEPHFRRKREERAARYRQFRDTQHASHELRQVLSAADQGRVEALFVSLKNEVWGRYDPESHAVEIHETRRPRDEDLLNLAALYAILREGAVYAVPPDQMPEQEIVAAVFRY